jgi:Skp family chaperone for outer membrane proteins
MRIWIIALAFAIAASTGAALSVHSAVAQTAQNAPATQNAPTAQNAPAPNVPVVVGVLDMQTIMQQSKAGQSLEAIKSAKAKAMNADMAQTEQDLRARRQQLDQARSSMTPADYEAKRADLDKQFEAFRKTAIGKRKELAQLYNKGIEQIFNTLETVIDDIAKKRGLTLIINRSFVVMSEKSWDITKEVLKGLDAKLAKVTL